MFKKLSLILGCCVAAFWSVAPAAADDGGTSPLEPAASIQIGLNVRVAYWGQEITASGSTPARNRVPVTVWIERAGGDKKILGTVRPSKIGKWRFKFKAALPGIVGATQGGVFAVASSAGGAKLGVSPRITLPSNLPLSKKRLVRVSASLTPRGAWSWTISRRTKAGLRQISQGRSTSSGRINKTLVSRRNDRLVVTVAPERGLNGVSTNVSVARLRPAVASWFGLYGEGVACGGRLGVNQIGVAHKTLPCGTKVTITYKGRTIVAPVIDRGPFIAGREFDLTGAAARALHFDGVGTIWVSP